MLVIDLDEVVAPTTQHAAGRDLPAHEAALLDPHGDEVAGAETEPAAYFGGHDHPAERIEPSRTPHLVRVRHVSRCTESRPVVWTRRE